MKPSFAVSALLPLLFACAAVSSAQGPPPIKMGLWEHDVTVQMSGMPNGGDSSHSMTTQSCYTPNTWRTALQNMQNRRQMPNTTCNTSNLQQDAHHVAFDIQCSGTGQAAFNTTLHVEMQFDSDESMHGSTTTKISSPNMSQGGMTMTSTIKSKFLGSDCGNVKPYAPPSNAGSGAPPS